MTLVELIMAMAVTAIILGGITATLWQVFSLNSRSVNHMTAVRQVQSAGYWVSHDALMAQSIEIGDDPLGKGFPLILTWTDWDGDKHEVTYTLENMIGGPKQLKRQHLTYDSGGSVIDNATSIVAQHIVPGTPKTYVEFTDGALIFTVTTSVGEGLQAQSETRVYEVKPRSIQ
jgi:type II secretory pathway component PulJ